MFRASEKLRLGGLKFCRHRRSLSFGLPPPGHMASFWIKPGYLHYPCSYRLLKKEESSAACSKCGGVLSQSAESCVECHLERGELQLG